MPYLTIRDVLTHAIRLCAGVACAATLAACVWALGIDHQPAPHTGVLVCVWTAAGAMAVRAVLLWVRGLHLSPGTPEDGVSLEKGSREKGPRAARKGYRRRRAWQWERIDGTPYESDGWIRTRQVGVHLLLLVAGMTAASFPGLPDRDAPQAALQRAGAEVATATIAEPPRVLREDYDEDRPDRVVGWSSRLRVSVPGGPARLPVGPVHTSRPLRQGERLPVLWAPRDPSLGAYHADLSELRALADRRWRVDLWAGGADGGAWALAAGIVGVCMLPWVFVFALGVETDVLSELAWSPLSQSWRALVAVAVAYGCTASLAGYPAHGFQAFCRGVGWAVLAGLIFTPVYRLIKDNR
ncbi:MULTISPECIES: hypothetical protein [Streptomyces]|uniref:hypothetical protein n=1 Tax=Streptomyces TaxID=1883 RepID=UPI00163C3323|nr:MULTISPECIES: hypothetical protein [Streptomyces]MBC2876242.1 hypothetical protein [Streptomyces sp. TYQ1024]UBI35533.1 hypothetical protein K7I03_02985 [Streptomyces mobaraensis]UKW28127.1 hypothetical protein MCU78_03015 [Streptomyces sp. TYQ1024]